jgi:hypothetical protein
MNKIISAVFFSKQSRICGVFGKFTGGVIWPAKFALFFMFGLVCPHTFLFDASDLGLIKTLTLLDALCKYATHHIPIAY